MASQSRRSSRSLPGLQGFREVLGRLSKVSKAELDAEERKYQAMRKRLRDKKSKRRKTD